MVNKPWSGISSTKNFQSKSSRPPPVVLLARQSRRGHWASIRVAHSTPPSMPGVSIRAGRVPLIDLGCLHRRGHRRYSTDAVRHNPSIPVHPPCPTQRRPPRRSNFDGVTISGGRLQISGGSALMKPRGGSSDPIRGGQSFRARPSQLPAAR